MFFYINFCKFKETNHATVAQSILKSVSNFEISYEDVYPFASDNVSYMKKCISLVKYFGLIRKIRFQYFLKF